MNSDQRVVAIGASSGIAAMLLSVWLLTGVLPPPAIVDQLAERLTYGLRANLVAVLPLFVMVITIANGRFASDAIDPTRGAETRIQEINGRVLENTLQQSFLFAIASLTASTLLPIGKLQVVWACAIWFVIARSAFWIGYRKHPLYRAPGMSGTAYMNLGLVLYCLYKMVT
jgi:hypothetical protein